MAKKGKIRISAARRAQLRRQARINFGWTKKKTHRRKTKVNQSRINQKKYRSPVMAKKRSRRPPRIGGGGGIVNQVTQVTDGLKTDGIGAIALVLNNFLAGQLSAMLKLSPANRSYVKIGTALIALPMIAKYIPGFGQQANTIAGIAAAVAVLEAFGSFLPANIAKIANVAGLGEIDADYDNYLLPEMFQSDLSGHLPLIPQRSLN